MKHLFLSSTIVLATVAFGLLGCNKEDAAVNPVATGKNSASAALSKQPTGESFVFLVTFPNGQLMATWSGTGTFTDGGSQTASPNFNAFFSPVVYTEQVVTVQNGAQGTFVMRQQRVLNSTGTIAGTWAILKGTGTGIYTTLEGEGTWSTVGSFPGDITVTAPGQVHFN